MQMSIPPFKFISFIQIFRLASETVCTVLQQLISKNLEKQNRFTKINTLVFHVIKILNIVSTYAFKYKYW